MRDAFEHLVNDGQHSAILFIGCSDSRLVTFLLTGTGPGDLFLVRNVGAFVPSHDMSAGFHGTAEARLMGYPIVRERVEAGEMTLHGWHYVIEDGEVHVFDVRSGSFVAVGLAAPVLLPAHYELGLGLVLLALVGMAL